MEILVERIEAAIQTEKHCFVRPEELTRTWPSLGESEREQAVREFARQHGWKIFTYSRVLGAMFVRDAGEGG
jgi:hypothetical protein